MPIFNLLAEVSCRVEQDLFERSLLERERLEVALEDFKRGALVNVAEDHI